VEIRPVEVTPDKLARYRELFAACFPAATHLDTRYLTWLYGANPAGTAIGFDAWAGEHLAAHYVCVPVDAVMSGRPMRVMLSLNTATHPDFQGQGLFTRLAEATYALGAQRGIEAVYGVANANSTPGFLRKLGFMLVRPLDALIGAGPLCAYEPAGANEVSFRRFWSTQALHWRISNPARPYRLIALDTGRIGAHAPTGRVGLHAWDELPAPVGMDVPHARLTQPILRLHLGLRPSSWVRRRSWVEVPRRLRPSPLNLIFRPLAAGLATPASDSVVLGQLDFDAF
jgi:GNAT superfamily N-acetyltransferase